MTHRAWHGKVQRLLRLGERRPTLAARGFHRLADAAERALEKGLHDWHVVQSLHLAGAAEAAAGDQRSAAATVAKIVAYQKALLISEQRAYVSACAAAAIEMAKGGDLPGARRMVRSAAPWARLLRPKERLFGVAEKLVRASSSRRRG